MEQFVGRKHGVEPVLGSEQRGFLREPFVQQPLGQFMRFKRIFGPSLKCEITIHEKFGKREEAELDRVAVHFPARSLGNDCLDLGMVIAWLPATLVSFELRQADAEIVEPALLER